MVKIPEVGSVLRSRTAGYCAAIILCLAVVAGCSSGRPDTPLATVTGRVTWNGQPLVAGLVAFEPEAGRPSFGRTDADGVYRLEYRGKPWGAVVGNHVVRITTSRLLNPEAEEQGAEPERVPEILPAEFNRETTLTATVTEGANTIDFELQGS